MYLSVSISEAGYSNNNIVLKDISFDVKSGELVGLIGANGAGKTTIIKSILGVTDYVKGDIQVSNYSYIPERPIIYDGLTLWEHIEFLLSVSETEEDIFIEKAKELVNLFQLTNAIHKIPESFSKGMQQKVMIILAFLKQSNIYIIDEPFMGLDPKAIKRLLRLIEKEKERGAGILMSTHALDTAEKICDRFILILNGKIVAQGDLKEIRERSELKNGSLLDCFDILSE